MAGVLRWLGGVSEAEEEAVEAEAEPFLAYNEVNLPLSAAAVVAVVVRSSRPSHLRTAMGARRLVVGNLSSTRSDPPTQATLPQLQNAHKKATCGIAMGARTETCSAALCKIVSPPNFTAAICPYDHARGTSSSTHSLPSPSPSCA
mmetsp:Transcript_38279/g.123875  ORF Transcript_38279/g.123875 Transcript_38279/m.123875 type:complete len:146 (+) Transcript_38279:82-519(+)